MTPLPLSATTLAPFLGPQCRTDPMPMIFCDGFARCLAAQTVPDTAPPELGTDPAAAIAVPVLPQPEPEDRSRGDAPPMVPNRRCSPATTLADGGADAATPPVLDYKYDEQLVVSPAVIEPLAVRVSRNLRPGLSSSTKGRLGHSGNAALLAFNLVDTRSAQATPDGHFSMAPGQALLSGFWDRVASPAQLSVVGQGESYSTAIAIRSTAPTAQAQIARADLQVHLASDGLWLDSLARDISSAATDSGRLTFAVDPETLGRLYIDLQREAGGTGVRLAASNDAARDVLAAAEPRLLDDLKSSGVRVSSFELAGGPSEGESGAGGGASRPPRTPVFEFAPLKQDLAPLAEANPHSHSSAIGRFA